MSYAERTKVAIQVDGGDASCISVGEVFDGIEAVGERVTIVLREENGMLVEQTGVVVDVL